MSTENNSEQRPVLTGRAKGEAEVQRRWGRREEAAEPDTGSTLTARQRGQAEAERRFGRK